MRRIAVTIGCGLLALGLGVVDHTHAAELPQYPDPDTEKACAGPGESPECAAKTFWLCSAKSVATCKLAGLNVQPDGSQYSDNGTAAGDAWTKPWTLPWSELLDVANPKYSVWEIKGLREVTPARLRGVARRSLTGTHEMMIGMINESGEEEKQSIFLAQRKGVWTATGFARWRDGEFVNLCERRKLGSLACRYTVNGLTPWQLDAAPPASSP
jgi:hypothetical protein